MMTIKENLDFAKRMNTVADKLGIPPKGKNRQELLGNKFGVSQESARKWLSGESIPRDSKCIEIAKEAKISYEWLKTGRGNMITEHPNITKQELERYNQENNTIDYDDIIKEFPKIAETLTRVQKDEAEQFFHQYAVLSDKDRKLAREIITSLYEKTSAINTIARLRSAPISTSGERDVQQNKGQNYQPKQVQK